MNVPLAYVNEDTIDYLARQQRVTNRAHEIAGELGLKRSLVAENWDAIQDHKWFLSERLGRDVGSKVAALDYFENVRPEGQRKTSIACRMKSALRHTFDSLNWDGPNSIVNLERALSGMANGRRRV